jgi:anti-sigma28 factor (negative regulator of flagellin synthesis)
MRINQSPLDSSSVSQLGRTAEIGSSATGSSTAARSDGDGFQLSNLSARLLASGETGGSDRAARVQQLSSDVKSGRYQVDAGELSRRLVDEAIRQ